MQNLMVLVLFSLGKWVRVVKLYLMLVSFQVEQLIHTDKVLTDQILNCSTVFYTWEGLASCVCRVLQVCFRFQVLCLNQFVIFCVWTICALKTRRNSIRERLLQNKHNFNYPNTAIFLNLLYMFPSNYM